MVDQIGIRFVAEGAEQAIQAIKNYRKVQTETVDAIKAGQAATAGFTRDLRTLLTAYQGAERASGAYKESLREVKRQIAALTGVSIQAASAAVEKLARDMDAAMKAVDDDAARRAFEQIRASVDPATAAVERFQAAMQKVDAALARGVITPREFSEVSGRLQVQRDTALDAPRAEAAAAYDRLRAAIDPTAAAAQKLAAAQKTVDAAIQKGIVTAEQGAQTMRALQQGLEDTGKANELLRRETQQLAAVYNPVMAAQMAFTARQEELNRALAIGVLNADRHAAEMQQLQTAFSQVGNTTVGAARFMNQYGESVRFGGVSTNRFGMYAQQVGYQVGDFFVQIQSGTNAFVAFGQQATQLAGLLPGLLGAVVGIGISVGTALLSMWDRTRQAQQGVEGLKEAFEELKSAIKSAEAELAQARFGAGSLEEARALLEQEALLRRLTEARAKYAEASARQEAGSPFSLATAGALGRAAGALRELEAEARALEDQLTKYQKLAEARAKQRRDAEWAAINQRNTLDAALEFFDAQVAAQVESYNVDKQNADAQAVYISGLQERLRLQQAINAYGEDSAQVLAIQREQHEAIVREQIRQLELADPLAAKVLETAMALYDAENAAGGVADGMDTIAARASAAAQAAFGIYQALQMSLRALAAQEAGIAAAQRVAARGGSETDVRVTQAAATEEARLRALGVEGVELTAGTAMAAEAERRRLAADAAEKQLFAGFNDSGSGAGTGAGASQFVSMFPELQAAYTRAAELASQYKQEVEILDSALARGMITQQQYNTFLESAQAAYEQSAMASEELMKRQDELAQRLGNTLGNLFVAATNGADAFRSALSNVLSSLASMLANAAFTRLLKSSGGGLLGALGGLGNALLASANGNVFMGGNVVPFANGGVVSGPTMFPMRNGTGLMGEAGPEAIMPLRRGRDGRLGVAAAQTQAAPVDVRVFVDQDGNWQAKVERIADRRVRQQAPTLVRQSVQAVYSTNEERKLR